MFFYGHAEDVYVDMDPLKNPKLKMNRDWSAIFYGPNILF